MEYMTPNFTKDMVKTHKILIPNMAVTQFRLMQAALASEGYQTEVLGNCGSEVAQLGLKYVHNDTCYPALLVIGQFLDALNSGKIAGAGLDAIETEPTLPNEIGMHRVAFSVDDLDAALEIAARHGCHPLRGVATYEDIYKLTYVRGPSGIIVMFAQELTRG